MGTCAREPYKREKPTDPHWTGGLRRALRALLAYSIRALRRNNYFRNAAKLHRDEDSVKEVSKQIFQRPTP
jgi:hypothetical protein